MRFQLSRGWSPLRDLSQVHQELNRMLTGPRFPTVSEVAVPAVNLYSGEHSLVVTAELPGVDPDKLDIQVTKDTLTIRGDFGGEEVSAGMECHRRERVTGAFSRTMTLPYEVDPAATEATCEQGVLKIKLTRPQKLVPQKVTVRSASSNV